MNNHRYCFIGTLVNRDYDNYILKNSKKVVPFSSINYNRKIIEAIISKTIEVRTLCTSGIGSYPKQSSLIKIPSIPCYGDMTICHSNIFGFRNISENRKFKKRINKMERVDNVIVSNIHSPFLYAAYLLKKKFKSKTLLIVYDLPENMNFSKKSLIYRVLKYFDRKLINKYLNFVDYYIVVSEETNLIVNKAGKPYKMIEGIIEEKPMLPISNSKIFLYAGSIMFAFDIVLLVESFIKANEKENNTFTLEICGNGDAVEYVKEMSAKYPFIKYLGMLSPSEVLKTYENVSYFVNPRRNTAEFTKYSFPSKNLEYLQTGKPMVGFTFSSVSKSLNNLIFSPMDNEQDLSNAFNRVMKLSENEIINYRTDVKLVLDKYLSTNYVNEIISMFETYNGPR